MLSLEFLTGILAEIGQEKARQLENEQKLNLPMVSCLRAPDNIDFTGINLRSLPGSESEAKNVAELLKVKPLIGKNADKNQTQPNSFHDAFPP